LTETQERFLRAVLERVDAPRVAELHLFPAIRRGAVETGVAVIAVALDAPVAVAVAEAPASEGEAEPAVALVVDAPGDVVASCAEVAPVDEYADAPDLGMPVDGDAIAIAAALAEPPELDAPVDGDMLTIAAAEGVAPDVDSPVDGDALTIAAAVDVVVADASRDIDSLLEDSPYAPEPARGEPMVAAEPVVEIRARIFTASYRLTIKGPDRGTWTVDVQEQAEAPLSAVEAVLRGVRQRSSDPADPENVPLAMLRRLREPAALPVAGSVTPAAPVVAAPAVVADAA
jgi:hypothetical protein